MTHRNSQQRAVALSFPATPSRLRAPRRWTCQLGAFPPIRMPLDTGGYLIEHVDIDPAGGCGGFTAVWHEYLSPTSTREGDLVLQLHTPEADGPGEPVTEQRVAVSLWLAREQQWKRVRTWSNAGAGWPQQVAPWIHAALTHTPAPPATGPPRRITESHRGTARE